MAAEAFSIVSPPQNRSCVHLYPLCPRHPATDGRNRASVQLSGSFMMAHFLLLSLLLALPVWAVRGLCWCPLLLALYGPSEDFAGLKPVKAVKNRQK